MKMLSTDETRTCSSELHGERERREERSRGNLRIRFQRSGDCREEERHLAAAFEIRWVGKEEVGQRRKPVDRFLLSRRRWAVISRPSSRSAPLDRFRPGTPWTMGR